MSSKMERSQDEARSGETILTNEREDTYPKNRNNSDIKCLFLPGCHVSYLYLYTRNNLTIKKHMFD